MTERAPQDEDRAVDDQGREFLERRRRFPANGMGFILVPVLWFGYFLAVYSLQGLGCAGKLLSQDALRWVLGVLTLTVAVAMVALGGWSYRAWRGLLDELDEEECQRRGHSTFLAYGALLHAGLFLVAMSWIGVPILLLDACGSLSVG